MKLDEHIKTAKRLKDARRRLMELANLGPRRIKNITKAESLRIISVVNNIDHVRNTLDNSYRGLFTSKQVKNMDDGLYF